MLISSPNLGEGNSMMQNEVKFRVLEKKARMTQLCEEASVQYLVTTGNRYQVRPDGEDGWWQITLLCREYVCSRVFPQAKTVGSHSSRHIYRPISEVHIVKILDEYGVEVAIPSICKPGDVTYVVISRETERFVNEFMLTKQKPDPVGHCSKSFNNPKKACLTNKDRYPLAQRKLG